MAKINHSDYRDRFPVVEKSENPMTKGFSADEIDKIYESASYGHALRDKLKTIIDSNNLGELRYMFMRNLLEAPTCLICEKSIQYDKGVYFETCSNVCKDLLRKKNNLKKLETYKVTHPWVTELSEYEACIEQGITSRPICQTCPNPTKFDSNNTYRIFCSIQCSGLGWMYKSKESLDQLKVKFPWISSIPEGIYCQDTNIKSKPICKMCENPVKFGQNDKPYGTYCSIICCNKDLSLSQQRYETRKAGWIEKYGVEHVSMLPEVRAKRISTLIERYGSESTLSTQEQKEKKRQTSLRNWGTENPMSNVEVYKKSSNQQFIKHEITHPSSKTLYSVQGFERFVFPIMWKLFDEGELSINRDEIPSIRYQMPQRNGVLRTRTYFPDGFIKHLNLIIEVKSTRTIIQDKKLEWKQTGVKEAGYNYCMILYDYRESDVWNSILECVKDEALIDKIKLIVASNPHINKKIFPRQKRKSPR